MWTNTRRSRQSRWCLAWTIGTACGLLAMEASLTRAGTNYSWLAPVSGNWNDGGRWTPASGIPGDGAGDAATIAASGAPYTVTLDQPRQLGGLLINSPTAVLDLGGQSLTTDSLTINQGELTVGSGAQLLGTSSPWLENKGTLRLGTAGASDPAIVADGSVQNLGTTIVDGPTEIQGNVDNHGSFTVASGGSALFGQYEVVNYGQFTVPAGASVRATQFRQVAGQLDATGSFEVKGTYFSYASGSIIGQVHLVDAALVFDNPAVGPASFSLAGESTLYRNIPAGQQIEAEGTVRWQHFFDFQATEQAGDLTLRPDGFGRAGLAPAQDLPLKAAPLTNLGSLHLEGSAAFPNVPLNLGAELTNQGLLEIAPGTISDYTGPQLTLAGGSFTNAGLLRMSNAALAFTGGTAAGHVTMHSGDLDLRVPGSLQVDMTGDVIIQALAAGHQVTHQAKSGQNSFVLLAGGYLQPGEDPGFLQLQLVAGGLTVLTQDSHVGVLPHLVLQGPLEGVGNLEIQTNNLEFGSTLDETTLRTQGNMQITFPAALDINTAWTVDPDAVVDLLPIAPPEPDSFVDFTGLRYISNPHSTIDNQGTLRLHGKIGHIGTTTGRAIDVVDGGVELFTDPALQEAFLSPPPGPGKYRIHDGDLVGDPLTGHEISFAGTESRWWRPQESITGLANPVADLTIGGRISVESGNLLAIPSAGHLTKNDGTLQLGAAGSLAASGDYVQTASGRLEVVLASGGTGPHLGATGTVSLGGTLAIVLPDDPSQSPLAGQEFEIVSAASLLGMFDFMTGLFYIDPETGLNMLVRPSYTSTSVTLTVAVQGDANGDGSVGAADYAVWATEFGQAGLYLSADFDLDGVVGTGDYAVWAANFGQDFTRAAAVPEPATLYLGVLGLAGLVLVARRRFVDAGRSSARPRSFSV